MDEEDRPESEEELVPFPPERGFFAPTERPEAAFPEPGPIWPPRYPRFFPGPVPIRIPFIGEPQCVCQARAVHREGRDEATAPAGVHVPPGGYPAVATLQLPAGAYVIFAKATVGNFSNQPNVAVSATLRRIGAPFGPWFDIQFSRLGPRWSVNEAVRLDLHAVITLVDADQGVLLYIGHSAALGDVYANDIWLTAMEAGKASVQHV